MAAVNRADALEGIVHTISTRFVGTSDLDRAIDDTLAEIGHATGADRAYLFLLRLDDSTLLDNTHEWCREGVEAQMEQLQRLPRDLFPWWMGEMERGASIHIASLDDLPPEAAAEKELFEAQDIRSLAAFPVQIQDGLGGFIGLDDVSEADPWTGRDIELLYVVAQILGRALSLERLRRERDRMAGVALAEAKRMEAIALLASGAAHDLNNLLTVVENYADLLQSQLVDPAQRRDIGEILDASQHASDLTRLLLGFGRRAGGRPVADTRDALDAVTRLLRRVLPPEIQLEVDCADDLPSVALDRGSLDQIILNLTLNAREAIEGPGVIRCSCAVVSSAPGTQRAGPWIRVAIDDDGEGMSEETLARVFEPLFTTKTSGTGLGLAMVRDIVDRNRGRMEVSSTLGAGSTFAVYLPTTVARPGPERAEASTPRAQGERVLLVEDDRSVRVVISRVLEAHGWSVSAVATLREGLAALATDGFDLVMTDLELPDGDGLQMAERAGARSVPVVVVSGHRSDGSLQRLSVHRGYRVVRKPFHRRELLAAAHDALR
ncbi:MAG: response regulator [Sandaracinaceae bacterium]|nr:MAG: response regulator [Sandaracinaceae bacterium]